MSPKCSDKQGRSRSRRANRIGLLGRSLASLAMLCCVAGCPLYSGGDPADSTLHLVRGQSVHLEKTYQFYITSNRSDFFELPVDQLEKLFVAPKWIAPPGVTLATTTVGRVEPTEVKWKDLYMEYTGRGYRIQLACDCIVQDTAPPGQATISVSFDHLNDELGRANGNNPMFANFVSDYKEGRMGLNEPIPVLPLRLYETTTGRAFRLYQPWIVMAAIAIAVIVVVVIFKKVSAGARKGLQA